MPSLVSELASAAVEPCCKGGTLGGQCSVHGYGIDAKTQYQWISILKSLSRLALTLTLLPFAAVAQNYNLPQPIESKMKGDVILCRSPESLFLLYEGAYLATKTLGDQVFSQYFGNAIRILTRSEECVEERQPLRVRVTGWSTIENPLKAPRGFKVYGRVQVPGYKRELYAIEENLPGLQDWMQQAIERDRANRR